MNTLLVEGMTLEPQTSAHADEMFAVLSDPAIYKYENEPPASVEWLRNRYRQLETRRSPDGSQQWLNWVVRLPDSRLAGYVQATVGAEGHCHIAYIFASAFWGKGYAFESVEAMIAELAASYGARTLWAVFKEDNSRSYRLLERLAFHPAAPADYRRHGVESDEMLMTRVSYL
ncbi:MAG: GNAT family N-acetyltransferase [Gammaproteobacteria bacterium]|nr:MAG: GNAT family N-acetyltransferase [Gammaproteobacteria bacterium]